MQLFYCATAIISDHLHINLPYQFLLTKNMLVIYRIHLYQWLLFALDAQVEA